MRVLDLFAGMKGWSAAFAARGHSVVTLDLEPKFNCTLTVSILDVSANQLGGPFDVVLASPPCTAFSVASIGKHWLRSGVPKTAEALLGQQMVAKTLELIRDLQPRYWVLENPRGMLRKLPVVANLPRVTVTYCHYGETRMKPTDLWGNFPPSWIPEPSCKNGDPCHVAAPRGSTTGTQGLKGAALRAKVPYDLSLAFCLAAERDLGNTP